MQVCVIVVVVDTASAGSLASSQVSKDAADWVLVGRASSLSLTQYTSRGSENIYISLLYSSVTHDTQDFQNLIRVYKK